MKYYEEQEALTATLDYFGGEELAADVFINKQALRDNKKKLLELTPDDMHWRAAREFARIEAKKFKKPMSTEEIFEYLKDFNRIMLQGSPCYGIGNKYQFTTLSNCYVIAPPLDSYAGIHYTDEQLSHISKRRGGVGTDLSFLRPQGSPTHNASRTSTGVVTFAQRYSNSTREVGQDGRRGALMLTLSVHHPQVLDFARMKMDDVSVTGANVSIRLTDEFLKAVENNEEYEQRWPVDSETPEISQMVNAKHVWLEIIKCAHARAEPGLLFWDTIVRESPADCYAKFGFRTICTNPCAELPLSLLDSCRLMLLNLFTYVVNPFTKRSYFDFDRFHADAKILQRLMDDLVDLEIEAIERIIEKVKKDPEPEYIKQRELDLWKEIKQNCINGRRTGSGITALGDTIAAMGLSYGSQNSIDFTSLIYQHLKIACYESSVDMAEEIGPFPIWDHELEKDAPFLLRIKNSYPGLWDRMKKYGRRNIALLTTAPVGTQSMEAGPRGYMGGTSGFEALLFPESIRRRKINMDDPNARVDFTDQNGDKWQEYKVYHPKVRMWMDITGETDITKSPYHGCCAQDIDWRQRVKMQAAAHQHVDHSISSTINLPADVSVEKVAEIYETAWKSGCKGITVYREGCRTGVILDAKKQSSVSHNAIKRPKDLPCDILVTTVKGHSFYVLIGLMDGRPYEVFAGLNDFAERVDKRTKSGVITRRGRGRYFLQHNEHEPIEISGQPVNDDHEAITRMVSISLRHSVQLGYIVHQLEKVEGDMFSVAKAIARSLKKYIDDGERVSGEECANCHGHLVRQEGCICCPSCGFSKCG